MQPDEPDTDPRLALLKGLKPDPRPDPRPDPQPDPRVESSTDSETECAADSETLSRPESDSTPNTTPEDALDDGLAAPHGDSGAGLKPNPLSDLLPMPTDDDLLFMSAELEELRDLIHRNDSVVLAGAPILAWWGVVNALAGFWNFFESLGYLPPVLVAPFNALAGYIGTAIIIKRMGSAKILRLDGQAISIAWVAAAVAIPLALVGCTVKGATDLAMMSGLQFIILGMATAVTAMGSRKQWLLWVAGAWAVMSAAMFFVVSDFWRPMVFSATCLALLTAPGIYLWRSARERA